ncbi:hypothetical protein DAPPUDRAFT_248248 [Daphnia pulex]|uniref:Uncharacterized protein n=1 Tax=Daphnia pulex TaxID=6669 RepID=E9GU02_DAPPU|nr:hypothetical protein DAPPUDRAFT_248248 [Daphnia pulex]|eukprot:EFX77057.1 hypothetical protein DAPPUDRAFT_248248 [Daphnia pulex]
MKKKKKNKKKRYVLSCMPPLGNIFPDNKATQLQLRDWIVSGGTLRHGAADVQDIIKDLCALQARTRTEACWLPSVALFRLLHPTPWCWLKVLATTTTTNRESVHATTRHNKSPPIP